MAMTDQGSSFCSGFARSCLLYITDRPIFPTNLIFWALVTAQNSRCLGRFSSRIRGQDGKAEVPLPSRIMRLSSSELTRIWPQTNPDPDGMPASSPKCHIAKSRVLVHPPLSASKTEGGQFCAPFYGSHLGFFDVDLAASLTPL